MASTGMQVLGLVLCLVGWVDGILVCAIPLWRVSAFIGINIVTAQTVWEGLWMSCVIQWTGELQCKVYDSLLALPGDMQLARGLTLLSLLLCSLALTLGVLGAKCTNCLGRSHTKARFARNAGTLFVLAGFIYLVPICWTAYAIVRDFYDPTVAAPLKRELGHALYLGWGAGGLLVVGGALLNTGSSSQNDPRSPSFNDDNGQNSSHVASGEITQDYV